MNELKKGDLVKFNAKFNKKNSASFIPYYTLENKIVSDGRVHAYQNDLLLVISKENTFGNNLIYKCILLRTNQLVYLSEFHHLRGLCDEK